MIGRALIRDESSETLISLLNETRAFRAIPIADIRSTPPTVVDGPFGGVITLRGGRTIRLGRLSLLHSKRGLLDAFEAQASLMFHPCCRVNWRTLSLAMVGAACWRGE